MIDWTYCEQQLPNEEPWQVFPCVPPHVPSVDTALLAKGEAGEAWATPKDNRPAASETRNFIMSSKNQEVFFGRARNC